MIRLSVGLENTEDIIADLDKAFYVRYVLEEVIYVQRNAKKETSLACGGNVSDPSSGNFRGIGSVWGR